MSDAGPRFVWVDGRVRPAGETHLSVFDRGFQLGDGVFETLRARGGHVTELAEHTRAPATLRGRPRDRAAGGRGAARSPAASPISSPPRGWTGRTADASVRITVSRGRVDVARAAAAAHRCT